MRPEMFTHVFVDEAGSMVETECLIPITCGLHQRSVVVLAGDPQQLGPIVHCVLCKERRGGGGEDGEGEGGGGGGGGGGRGRGGELEMSLLERLMTKEPSRSIYVNGLAREGGSGGGGGGGSGGPLPRFFSTKLIRNYRSHPAILELPSRLFYNNELLAEANVLTRSSLCLWDMLPNKNQFPLLFHGVDGTAMRDEDSPSFYNAEECAQVVRYVENLLADRTLGLRSADVGVVAAYRRQVQKLQQYLLSKPLSEDLKVGSVEEFQGQERRVIVLTTVRESPKDTIDELHREILLNQLLL
ncbi:hypothetical protein CBR_g44358 [Chara braunii]|uniref:Uncharacterized protein n=1 Tax=Chara braunii TaxID=69332 RepID=A0A388LXE5_CHABU|nr:hypothetical protein CBR_g44358 [Chara braunii]|eukprot:GBG86902.1 hypothetical protein CBR_g44358 [Chara braunii]